MDISNFKGLGTALVTPFRPDGSIDFTALEQFIEFQIKGGVDSLVALGTTSEAATMTADERIAVVDFIIDVNKGRLPLIVGCGGNNTKEVVYNVKNFEKPGIDAILSVVPYYNKPNQIGLYEHFKAIANATALPIILYNVPGRTAANIESATVLKLANNFKNIIAIKEASGDMAQIMQLLKNKPKDFIVLSGDDALTLPLISLGFDGVISVVSNAYPAEFKALVKAALENDFAKAREWQFKLVDIYDSLFVEGNPAGVKRYLQQKGLMTNNLRLPLVPVSNELGKYIDSLAKKI